MKIYFVDASYQADFKVFFTDKEYKAGWKTRNSNTYYINPHTRLWVMHTTKPHTNVQGQYNYTTNI